MPEKPPSKEEYVYRTQSLGNLLSGIHRRLYSGPLTINHGLTLYSTSFPSEKLVAFSRKQFGRYEPHNGPKAEMIDIIVNSGTEDLLYRGPCKEFNGRQIISVRITKYPDKPEDFAAFQIAKSQALDSTPSDIRCGEITVDIGILSEQHIPEQPLEMFQIVNNRTVEGANLIGALLSTLDQTIQDDTPNNVALLMSAIQNL